MIEFLKEEMRNSLKEMEEKTNKQMEEKEEKTDKKGRYYQILQRKPRKLRKSNQTCEGNRTKRSRLEAIKKTEIEGMLEMENMGK